MKHSTITTFVIALLLITAESTTIAQIAGQRQRDPISAIGERPNRHQLQTKSYGTSKSRLPVPGIKKYLPPGTNRPFEFAQTTFLDKTFGTNGSVRTFIPGGSGQGDEILAIALQSDGKIVGAGISRYGIGYFSIAVARYNADGTPDYSFGSDGCVRRLFPGSDGTFDELFSVAIQPDGKIVAGGSAHRSDGYVFALARFLADGTPDSTFDADGFALNHIAGGGTYDLANAIAIQPDGKIVACGTAYDGDGTAIALARYDTSGKLDASFGSGGSICSHISEGDNSEDVAKSVCLLPDGRIVAGGYSYDGYDYGFAVARFKANGTPDSTFGTNGSTLDFISGGDGYDDEIYSVALQSDGKIVGGGYSNDETDGSYAFALARYDTTGKPDTTFRTTGSFLHYISTGSWVDDELYGLAIQSDGKIVAGGTSYSEDYTACALARYDTVGNPDSTFGTYGAIRYSTADPPGDISYIHAVALQPDGKIVAGGSAHEGSGGAFAVSRIVAYPVGFNTLDATNVDTTSATLNGRVNALGTSTSVRFLYGTNPGSYTDSIAATPSTVSADTGAPVCADVVGLRSSQMYYYSVSTSSVKGYYRGEEKIFMTPGKDAGNAVKFDPENFECISIPNTVLAGIGDSITVEAWINPAQTGVTVRIVDHISVGGSDGFLLDLVNGKPRIIVGAKGVNAPNALPSANTWYHVAGTYDRSNLRIYVNGILQGELSHTDALPKNPVLDVLLGIDRNYTSRYTGLVDELRIWKTARDSTQIRLDMHRALTGLEAGLVGYWRCDEAFGTTLRDLSTGANHGTLYEFDFDAEDGWQTSTAPCGAGTSTNVSGFTNGTATLGTVSLTTTDDFDSAVELVATEIGAPPDTLPTGSAVLLGDRYWVLSPYGTPGSYSADLTFTVPSWFTAADAGTYILYRRGDCEDGSWTPVDTGASSKGATTITFSGVTSMSQFMIGSSDAGLPVQAAEFAATSDVGSVTLTWKTKSEVDNAGFNVLRKDPGATSFKLVSGYQLNAGLRGLGTSSAGRSYRFTDDGVLSRLTYSYKVQSVSASGGIKDIGMLTVTVGIPREYALYQNYPNPFNPSTTIRFDLKQASNVRLEVFNMLGQCLEDRNLGMMEAGRYNEMFDMSQCASGVYFYRINAVGVNGEKFVSLKKMMMIK